MRMDDKRGGRMPIRIFEMPRDAAYVRLEDKLAFAYAR